MVLQQCITLRTARKTSRAKHSLPSLARLHIGRCEPHPGDVAVRRLVVKLLAVVEGHRAVEGQREPALELRVASAGRGVRAAGARWPARRHDLKRPSEALAVDLGSMASVSQTRRQAQTRKFYPSLEGQV